jgi:exodeoxyribonuclease VII small subunit
VAKSKSAVDKLSFEEALRELESIVRRLEGAELTLDEALGLFERGQALAARCGALLDEADLKVKQITPTGVLEDFDEDL